MKQTQGRPRLRSTICRSYKVLSHVENGLATISLVGNGKVTANISTRSVQSMGEMTLGAAPGP